ncbi:4-hydroxy-tetrahydrodipicolinate reductase [Iamia majanohamensis]|uniref:4-hydroxy-tetrahydrodipicolinate reductase n=1 Tax=Iamia majanohamensis TaxID=467976 RepID=A0AAF0BU05_9ACTN|nr:4-hydroxy-tetrahydrodipicolinate reductase [Iamia majanohamensis]WCO65395.1 4-hydroxy-tetrahydrodipicolinate reductase [Iamia majanohamensis]
MARRVAVFGAGGRMGSTVCRAVMDDPDLDLVAVVDPHHAGLDLRQVTGLDTDLVVDADADGTLDAGAEVAVDFTLVEAARQNLAWCAENGVHAVVGTSGFGEDDVARAREQFTRSNCVIAPNFAIGAVLMMHFAELAAPYFDTADIVETHHDAKVDAPSGTAMATAERMAAASSTWAADPTTSTVLDSARGAELGGVRVHSLRVRGMVAHQEVVLGTTGQTLTIRHDSYDRASFMPGVVLAVKAVEDHPGVTLGLRSLLGLVPGG